MASVLAVTGVALAHGTPAPYGAAMTAVGLVTGWVAEVSSSAVPTEVPSTSAPAGGGSSGLQVATLLVAILAVVATVVSAILLRLTGKGTVDAADRSAKAADKSAAAAQKAADAATTTGREAESRSRREEVMRNLRWAAELALSDNDTRAELGITQLKALSASNLSDNEVQTFVDTALNAVVDPVAEALERNPNAQIDPPSDTLEGADSNVSDDDAKTNDMPVDSGGIGSEETEHDE